MTSRNFARLQGEHRIGISGPKCLRTALQQVAVDLWTGQLNSNSPFRDAEETLARATVIAIMIIYVKDSLA